MNTVFHQVYRTQDTKSWIAMENNCYTSENGIDLIRGHLRAKTTFWVKSRTLLDWNGLWLEAG